MKLKREDKTLIKAYFNWARAKGYRIRFPAEYDCSRLLDNNNMEYRDLIDSYLNELRLKFEMEVK